MSEKQATSKRKRQTQTSPDAEKTQSQDVKAGAETAKEEVKPQIALFGQLGFATVAQFDEYVNRMKANNYNDILLTVNVAVRAISQRGGFSLEENEAVSVALRHLNGAFSVQQPAEGAAETADIAQ